MSPAPSPRLLEAPPLLDHQVEGIAWLRSHDRALLADEPGLGKSRQALEAAVEPILVAAPAAILDSGTWDDEVAAWAPGADVTQVSYSSICQRREKGRVQRDRHGFPIVELKPELRRRWGTVIADESHYLKGRKTSWTNAFFQFDTERMFLMTGTPIPNWAHEAFTTLQLLYPEEARPGRRLGSYWRWVNEWFQVSQSQWSQHGKEIGGLLESRTWDEFYQENWRDRMLLRLRDECLDLPPLTQSQYLAPMTTAQARVYRQLKQDFVSWLESGTEVVAWNSAAQLVKLCKAATGLEVLEPGAGESGKLNALRTILTDRPRPTLVVAHFRDTVAACERVAREVGASTRLVDGGVSKGGRLEAVRAFQRGNADVMCATLDTISEGMTLHQGGADQVVFVERSWRPSRNEQALRRLHRIGQTRPVQAINLVAPRTVDERVLRLLADKVDEQMSALGRKELRDLA